MSDIQTRLATLRRPRLLLSAARFGLVDYDRDAALSRIVGAHAPVDGQTYLDTLLVLEDRLNEQRKAREASYSFARHVEVLVALLGERACASEAATG
ncbi:DUF6477 family protein [Palleronia sp. LCG004]|uniref:DUF6477 family protein n=1 Tax=Palleronia sp. LCG004 TaxID=3079304 RepID=UPI0029439C37|nr:DUF6477 family protein [Palleronia sp. LCG004]WOI56744.1 DUF6477 family protein [Palleronia sp. LCG004]